MHLLGISIIHLPLILKQSFIWHFDISSELKACNQQQQKFFLPRWGVWSHINESKSLIRKYCLSPSSLINNKSISFVLFAWHIDWIFFFVLITKNADADRTLFFNIVTVSNFDWEFYVFKRFCKIFGNICNFS